MLLVISTLSGFLAADVNIVSAQTLDDDKSVVCVVHREESDETRLIYSIDSGEETESRLTTVKVSCPNFDKFVDMPNLDEEGNISIKIYNFNKELTPEMREEFVESIEGFDFNVLAEDQLSENPNVNCHSYTIQTLQDRLGFDLGVRNSDWDNAALINYFPYLFTRQIGYIDEDNEKTTLEDDFQVNDIVFFHEWSGMNGGLGYMLLHSGLITDFNEDGEPIVTSKLGQGRVVKATVSELMRYYKAEQADILRMNPLVSHVEDPE